MLSSDCICFCAFYCRDWSSCFFTRPTAY